MRPEDRGRTKGDDDDRCFGRSRTTARILNDQFRESFVGGLVNIISGLAALSDDVRAEVLRRVREFKTSPRTIILEASTTSDRSTSAVRNSFGRSISMITSHSNKAIAWDRTSRGIRRKPLAYSPSCSQVSTEHALDDRCGLHHLIADDGPRTSITWASALHQTHLSQYPKILRPPHANDAMRRLHASGHIDHRVGILIVIRNMFSAPLKSGDFLGWPSPPLSLPCPLFPRRRGARGVPHRIGDRG